MTESGSTRVSLQEAAPGDAPLLHCLMIAAYEEYRDTLIPASGAFDESIEDVRTAIEEGGAVLVLVDGEPAGCGRFEWGADRSFIEVGRLSVLPAYRGRGLARTMLAWFEERAAALGVPEVRLGVRLNLPRNIALYERAGYEVFDYEDRPDFGRVSAWMRKVITVSG